ncbi:ABC transporter substrate-binding protein [Emcibacter sp. SYSU 3D8]|uniref:ABC transporter substrate-binding protein n=1 Tax=Emcibacter sp. SYSU 3D8 TaxID=3133969 RepID=UPI0031FF3784
MNGLRFLAMAWLSLIAAACSDDQTAGQATEGSRIHISFATDWRAQAEQGGFYQALATGEYEKRGIDVSIMQGGPAVNVPQLLASGAVDLGMGSNSFIVMNLAAEEVPVKAVAAFMQKDPQVLIAHPGQGIASIADMKGRPILLGDASVTAFWVWLKAKYGFTDDMVRKYTFNPAPFIADETAIQQGYVTSEPYTIEKQAGFAPEVFLLADEGYPGYAAMVLAPDALIARNPEAVRAFVEGSAAGWQSYLNGDPAPGDALILQDNPEATPELLAQAREKMKSYGIVESGDAVSGGIGAMTDARWAEFFSIATAQGVYPSDLDYRNAYTLEFLKPAAP